MVLRSSHELALKTKKYKAAINKNITTIDQMEGLISTLLMIARSETNGFVTKSTMIAPLVQRIGDIVREQYSDKDITLTIQGDAAVTVQAHASSVERLLHNLLSNAYKYTLP
jgi:signal transduction histidine kinase